MGDVHDGAWRCIGVVRPADDGTAGATQASFTESAANRLAVVKGPEPWTRALMRILSPEKNATICRFNCRLVCDKSWKKMVWCGMVGTELSEALKMQT